MAENLLLDHMELKKKKLKEKKKVTRIQQLVLLPTNQTKVTTSMRDLNTRSTEDYEPTFNNVGPYAAISMSQNKTF